MKYFQGDGHVSLPNKDILSWIFDDPNYDVDKPIYFDAADPTRSLSHRQARTMVRQVIAGLRAMGFQRGDCLCVTSFNDIYYTILVLGIVGAGGIFTGTNPSYTPQELVHHIKVSRTKYFIAEPELLGPIEDAAVKTGLSRSNILVFDPLGQAVPEGYRSWRSLLNHGEEDWIRFDDEKLAKSTTITRLFSSGTTGLPKAVDHSHTNMIAQHTLVFEKYAKPFEERYMHALPMFHASTVPMLHFSTFRAGRSTYIMRRYDLEGYLANIEKYRVTHLIIVPPIVIHIIMSPLSQKYSLKSVRSAWCGSAPLDKITQRRFQALLAPNSPVTQVWGMTELSAIATLINYPEADDTGSVGRLIPNMEAKLVDDDDNNISAYDTRGEILIRGPTLINGYFDNPKANKESYDHEGFFRTGDIAYCDSKTKLWYIVDRKKELIKVRAFQVAPPELEAVIMDHPHVVDAAVIGVQESIYESEFPRAYVVRRDTPEGAALTEEDIKTHVAGRLAKYKRLEAGVRFVDSIPKNPSGKILKRVFREQVKKELAAKQPKL